MLKWKNIHDVLLREKTAKTVCIAGRDLYENKGWTNNFIYYVKISVRIYKH